MGAWWSWVLAGAIALGVLLALARRAWRASVRQELLELLRAELPQVQLLGEAPGHLDLGLPGGARGRAELGSLYWKLSQLPASAPPEARRELYLQFLGGLRDLLAARHEQLTLEEDGPRVLPRLVSSRFLDDLPPEAGLPHTPLGETGLQVAYVLDQEHSVVYLTRAHLDELGLDRAGAHALALRNLAARTPPELLERALQGDDVAVIKTGDSYDAARLLLVPARLGPERSVLAAIPDRDTLVLMPAGFTGAREVARAAGERPLLDRPIRVSAEGWALV